SGHQFTAAASGAQYQWLNCGTGYTPVPGATSQTFSPTADGAYAVAVTVNNCTDTSSCVVYSTVGLNEALKTTVSGSPNPVNDVLKIYSEEVIRSVEVRDLAGKQYSISFVNSELSMSDLSPGVYLVHVTIASGGTNILRIVKQ